MEATAVIGIPKELGTTKPVRTTRDIITEVARTYEHVDEDFKVGSRITWIKDVESIESSVLSAAADEEDELAGAHAVTSCLGFFQGLLRQLPDGIPEPEFGVTEVGMLDATWSGRSKRFVIEISAEAEVDLAFIIEDGRVNFLDSGSLQALDIRTHALQAVRA